MRNRVLLRGVSLALLASVVLNGCATILGGGTSQGVSISSQPVNGTYTIKSSSGLQMGSGSVPAQVRLPRKNEYQIEITADGYKPQIVALTKSLNGWVWGNLIIGWIIGFGIDFIGGAAYKLEPAIVSVTMQTAYLESGDEALFAIITLMNKQGKVIGERRVEMERIKPSPVLVGTVPVTP